MSGRGHSRREPDADLAEGLRRAQNGEEQGFRLLWLEYQPRVLRYVTARGAHAPEDVASETWLRVVRELGRFSGGIDEFTPWLFTVARNQAIDAARHRARRPVLLAPPEELLDHPGGGDPVQEVLNRLSLQDALALIRSLPEDQADAVALRVIADLDPVTVARVLGKSPGAVRVATHRGLRTLAARLSAAVSTGGVTP